MSSFLKVSRECLTLMIVALSVLSLATHAWQRMYFMQATSDGVTTRRPDGYFHDFFQDIGLALMQENPCKDGKSLPDNYGSRYGGKACSFSVSTYHTLQETSLTFRYTSISGLLIGTETECYKSHVEDTRALSDRFGRVIDGFTVCACMGYFVVFLLVALFFMRIFRSRFGKGIVPIVSLLVAFVLSLTVLITTIALPPSSKYEVCVWKDTLLQMDYTDVFTPGWSWYLYLVCVILFPGLFFLEYKCNKSTTGEE
jgi:hypothetical protein